MQTLKIFHKQFCQYFVYILIIILISYRNVIAFSPGSTTTKLPQSNSITSSTSQSKQLIPISLRLHHASLRSNPGWQWTHGPTSQNQYTQVAMNNLQGMSNLFLSQLQRASNDRYELRVDLLPQSIDVNMEIVDEANQNSYLQVQLKKEEVKYNQGFPRTSSETITGMVSKKFPIPSEVDISKITYSFDGGVLSACLPIASAVSAQQQSVPVNIRQVTSQQQQTGARFTSNIAYHQQPIGATVGSISSSTSSSSSNSNSMGQRSLHEGQWMPVPIQRLMQELPEQQPQQQQQQLNTQFQQQDQQPERLGQQQYKLPTQPQSIPIR